MKTVDGLNFIRVPVDRRAGRNRSVRFHNIKHSDHSKTAEGIGFDIKSGDPDQIRDDDHIPCGNRLRRTLIKGVTLLNIACKHSKKSP